MWIPDKLPVRHGRLLLTGRCLHSGKSVEKQSRVRVLQLHSSASSVLHPASPGAAGVSRRCLVKTDSRRGGGHLSVETVTFSTVPAPWPEPSPAAESSSGSAAAGFSSRRAAACRGPWTACTATRAATWSSSSPAHCPRTPSPSGRSKVGGYWPWSSVWRLLFVAASVICLLTSCACLVLCLLANIYIAVNIFYKRKYQVSFMLHCFQINVCLQRLCNSNWACKWNSRHCWGVNC